VGPGLLSEVRLAVSVNPAYEHHDRIAATCPVKSQHSTLNFQPPVNVIQLYETTGPNCSMELLPLLVVSAANAVIWSLSILRHGFSAIAIGAVILVTLLAGAVAPNGLRWFTTLCMILPVLVAPDFRHGALIFHLLYGFRFPPLWIYFLMNFTPFFLPSTALVWIGDRIGKRVKSRFGRFTTAWPVI
jgi:hypothetical protein